MYYSPMKFAGAVSINVDVRSAQFVAVARDIVRTSVRGYTTDDYGLTDIFIPSVFRDPGSARFLAGYEIEGDDEYVIDATDLHADAESAAIAADKFADLAAERIRVASPVPSALERNVIASRARAPWLTSGPAVDAVRAAFAMA
jgi:hypothetical protein